MIITFKKRIIKIIYMSLLFVYVSSVHTQFINKKEARDLESQKDRGLSLSYSEKEDLAKYNFVRRSKYLGQTLMLYSNFQGLNYLSDYFSYKLLQLQLLSDSKHAQKLPARALSRSLHFMLLGSSLYLANSFGKTIGGAAGYAAAPLWLKTRERWKNNQ